MSSDNDNGNNHTQPDTDAAVPPHRRDPVRGTWKDLGDEHEYIVLADGADHGDVEIGRRYFAVVNNVVDFGVFVSLSNYRMQENRTVVGRPGEVSGLIHSSALPPGRSPADFVDGDEVGVMVIQRKRNGDLNFELVAAFDCLRLEPFERDPVKAALRWHTQGVDADGALAPDAPGTEETPPDGEAETNTGDADDADANDDQEKYAPANFEKPQSAADLYRVLDAQAARLDNLDAALNDLERTRPAAGDPEDIGALTQRLDRLERDVEELRGTLRSTRGWLGTLAETAEEHDDEIGGLSTQVGRLADRVGHVEERQSAEPTADGRGLPGRFGYAERMLHDLAGDHEATVLDLTELPSGDGVRITLEARPEEV